VEKIVRPNNEVRLLVNEHPKNHITLLTDIAKVYMIVFGNALGVLEGGTPNGETISLDTYMSHVVQSTHFLQDCQNSTVLCDIGVQKTYTTRQLLSLLQWAEELNEEKKNELLTQVAQKSGGYKPYYTSERVLKRFVVDLTPAQEKQPIVSYWGDNEYDVCGFLTGIVISTPALLSEIIDNVSYLTPGQREQTLRVLATSPFPILFEHEGAIIAERAGKENGSKWGKLHASVRNAARSLGATHSFGLTFEVSNYYQGGKRRGFARDVLINAADGGHPMQLVVNLL